MFYKKFALFLAFALVVTVFSPLSAKAFLLDRASDEGSSKVISLWCKVVARSILGNYMSFDKWCGRFDEITPEPEPTPMPEPSPSPGSTSEPTPIPTPTPTVTPSPTLAPTPSPAPTPVPTPIPTPPIDHILISEVYYDVDSEHGSETTNEWVELFNGTGAEVDLTNWSIADAKNQRQFPDGIILSSDKYAIITKDVSTADFWSLSRDVVLIVLDSAIGNGLSNSGDALYLIDNNGDVADALSWGTNTDVFDLSGLGITEGDSLARENVLIDTDTADDWTLTGSPTPGM